MRLPLSNTTKEQHKNHHHHHEMDQESFCQSCERCSTASLSTATTTAAAATTTITNDGRWVIVGPKISSSTVVETEGILTVTRPHYRHDRLWRFRCHVESWYVFYVLWIRAFVLCWYPVSSVSIVTLVTRTMNRYTVVPDVQVTVGMVRDEFILFGMVVLVPGCCWSLAHDACYSNDIQQVTF